MPTSWDRITAWLGQHAPSMLERLQQPTDIEVLRSLLSQFPFDVPRDLVDLWSTVDGESTDIELPGQGYLIPESHSFCSSKETLAFWRIKLGSNDVVPDGEEIVEYLRHQPAGSYISQSIWIPEWIPLSNYTDGLFVDCRVGEFRGCVAQYYHMDGQDGPLWDSIPAMLSNIADRLEDIDVDAIDPTVDSPEVGGWLIPWG